MWAVWLAVNDLLWIEFLSFCLSLCILASFIWASLRPIRGTFVNPEEAHLSLVLRYLEIWLPPWWRRWDWYIGRRSVPLFIVSLVTLIPSSPSGFSSIRIRRPDVLIFRARVCVEFWGQCNSNVPITKLVSHLCCSIQRLFRNRAWPFLWPLYRSHFYLLSYLLDFLHFLIVVLNELL